MRSGALPLQVGDTGLDPPHHGGPQENRHAFHDTEEPRIPTPELVQRNTLAIRSETLRHSSFALNQQLVRGM